MSREWRPGDVAMVNNRYDAADWHMAACVAGGPVGEARWIIVRSGARVWGSVTEVRPLVVIDPEDREQVERLTHLLGWALAPSDAGQLADALREFANPTPRIEEPAGIGAVVEDSDGSLLVHDAGGKWVDKYGDGWNWSMLEPVAVLSEGVQP